MKSRKKQKKIKNKNKQKKTPIPAERYRSFLFETLHTIGTIGKKLVGNDNPDAEGFQMLSIFLWDGAVGDNHIGDIERP